MKESTINIPHPEPIFSGEFFPTGNIFDRLSVFPQVNMRNRIGRGRAGSASSSGSAPKAESVRAVTEFTDETRTKFAQVTYVNPNNPDKIVTEFINSEDLSDFLVSL